MAFPEIDDPSKYFQVIKYVGNQTDDRAMTFDGNSDMQPDWFLTKRYDDAYKHAIKLKDKIKKLRSSGLHRDCIYSIENMTFKVLRNNGYLEQLSTLKLLAYDKMMSMDNGTSVKVNINKIFSDYVNSF